MRHSSLLQSVDDVKTCQGKRAPPPLSVLPFPRIMHGIVRSVSELLLLLLLLLLSQLHFDDVLDRTLRGYAAWFNDLGCCWYSLMTHHKLINDGIKL
jgi:hypothetical protein